MLYSHMSLLRFAEVVFGLEPLNFRDAGANDILDCFDFNQEPLPPFTLGELNCSASAHLPLTRRSGQLEQAHG